jgi:hypothetical protein
VVRGRAVEGTCWGAAEGDLTDDTGCQLSRSRHGRAKFLGKHLITSARHHPPGLRPSDLKQFTHAAAFGDAVGGCRARG